MFHAKDGLAFEQSENGGVIVHLEGMKVSLDMHSWASVIATMSYYGEEDFGYYRALNFHAGKTIHETCPLKEKTPPDWK